MSRPDEARREAGDEEPRVVIRDRRRIDPLTGAAREGSTGAAAGAPTPGGPLPGGPVPGASVPGGSMAGGSMAGGSMAGSPAPSGLAAGAAGVPPVGVAQVPVPGDVASLQAQLDERTADLQRTAAEYANYRRRSDRDRTAAAELAAGQVLAALVPVLDDVERARGHGDLTGAFASVAEQLVQTLTKLGLTAFGEVGDTFDPTVHEAVTYSVSGEVTRPTCVLVMRRGYSLGERLVRAAMVGVAEPASVGTGAPDPGGPPAAPGAPPTGAPPTGAPVAPPTGAPPVEDLTAGSDAGFGGQTR